MHQDDDDDDEEETRAGAENFRWGSGVFPVNWAAFSAAAAPGGFIHRRAFARRCHPHGLLVPLDPSLPVELIVNVKILCEEICECLEEEGLGSLFSMCEDLRKAGKEAV